MRLEAAEKMDKEYTQVAGWLVPFTRALEMRHIDSRTLLKQAGINPAIISEPGSRLPARKMDRLWQLAFEQGSDLTLGLDYAANFQPGNLYVLSFGLYSSLNLQQATEHLRYPLRLLTYAARVDCYSRDNGFHVEVRPTYPGSVHEKQIFFHAVLLGIWRSLSGRDLRPLEISLHDVSPPRDPAVLQRLQAHFGCPLHFNAAVSRISLPLAVAEAPLPAADPVLVRQGDSIIAAYLADLDHEYTALNVIAEVLRQFSSGRFDKNSVASHLGISSSTLQRRLTAEGTSFQQLLNDTRRDLAGRHVREGRRSIKEIAYQLGFADVSNFTRAFRKWFGMPPSEYQKSPAADSGSPGQKTIAAS